MIVVDSNVLAYLYLPGDYTEAAERLYQRDTDWHAPILWRSEYRNILVGYMRRGVLTPGQAYAIQREAEALLDGAEHEPDSKRVPELAQASDCSACDCEFVALAETLGVTVMTMDAKLIKAFPKMPNRSLRPDDKWLE
ncbi:MAG: type II toxin-antitoxin system VapC family toxin [Zoogloeaceae bacterium]|jgi:predicted nucleic acid-binding protein|nr:type II toxin-antitoxin system VapC family toxin [Zoogloeaceae bacterium]